VSEGSTTIVVSQQKGVDFQLTSKDLTLKVDDISERILQPRSSNWRTPSIKT
jgi:hypothetical protein